MSGVHVPVMQRDVLEGLDPQEGNIVFDGTVGNGGHALVLSQHIGPYGTYIGVDKDEKAIEEARHTLKGSPVQIILEVGNYRDAVSICAKHGISSINRALLDLGLRSDQLETSGRGFSFKKDEPLVMTFSSDGDTETFTAYDIVNGWNEESISDVLRGYGEERYARRIAKAIVSARDNGPIKTTGQLVNIIVNATPYSKKSRIHPATRTFQALRITVNDEIETLKDALPRIFSILVPGGRLAVISFHSLEDRIVKQFMRAEHQSKRGIQLTKKPLTPSRREIEQNPRARSAMLRIIEKANT